MCGPQIEPMKSRDWLYCLYEHWLVHGERPGSRYVWGLPARMAVVSGHWPGSGGSNGGRNWPAHLGFRASPWSSAVSAMRSNGASDDGPMVTGPVSAVIRMLL